MLLVIGAMEKELEVILKAKSYHKKRDSLGFEYHDPENKYLIVISNIGLSNASLTLSHWLTKYPQVKQILVLGAAGSISLDFQQGDECYIQTAFYGGAEATIFGYEYGQIPGMPASYSLSFYPPFLSFLERNPRLKRATIASSDIFIHDKKQAQCLQEKFNRNLDLVDMETAAFLQTAFCFRKPLLAIKIVSDCLYDLGNSSLSFEQFLPQVATRLHRLLEDYLQNAGLLK